MDCCVRVLFGESVRREDGMFEDMEEELKWFDEPPSFNDLWVRAISTGNATTPTLVTL